MKHIPRDMAEREVAVAAFLNPNSWDAAHLRSTHDRLVAGMNTNFNRWERENGKGTYSRLVLAFNWAEYRLTNEGAIHPADLEIVEAYNALPHRTGTWRDDEIDFITPWNRLREALTASLYMVEATRNEIKAGAYK